MALVMRAAGAMLAAALSAVLGGCQPDIGSGVYYCGPERACPPELACDDATATCVFASQVQPFSCGADRNLTEPDDDLADVFVAGLAGCGPSIASLGCADAAADVDHLQVTTPEACRDVLVAEIQFSLAFAPLTVDILDADGAVLATGAVCDDLDAEGQVSVCAEVEVDGPAPYVVRVRLADDAADCDDTCAFNQYQLSIF